MRLVKRNYPLEAFVVRQTLSERELLLNLGQALPPGIPPPLAKAAMAIIADCDPDQYFEDGLELMLAGLATSTDIRRAT